MAGLAAGAAGARSGIAAQDATPAAFPASPPPVSAPAGYDSATRDDTLFNATFRHEFLQVDGVLMHAVVGGDGPPVVLLHGWPQTWYEWIEILPALAENHTVVAVDLPGLGDSVGAPPSYDKKTLAGYVHGFVSGGLGYAEIDLVGHDLGAGVAYQYAAQFPGEVRRLVVMDYPLPGPGMPGEGQPPEAILNLAWHIGFHAEAGQLAERLVDDDVRAYLDAFYDIVAAAPGPLSEAAVDEFARTYAAPQQLTGGFELYRTLPQDVVDNLASAATPLPMPVLVITGQRDLIPGVDRLEFFRAPAAALATDVEAVDIRGAGHWLAEEQPEAVADAILGFLDA